MNATLCAIRQKRAAKCYPQTFVPVWHYEDPLNSDEPLKSFFCGWCNPDIFFIPGVAFLELGKHGLETSLETSLNNTWQVAKIA